MLAALAIQKETVSQRLTELREARELTQEKAAALVGVTMRQWQRWEGGESVPYPRNLEAIAEKFEIDVGEFFDGIGVVSSATARGPRGLEDRLARLETKLDEMERERVEHAERIGSMLERQTEILSRIEELVLTLPTDEVTLRLLRALEGEVPPPASAPSAPAATGRAKRARRRAAG